MTRSVRTWSIIASTTSQCRALRRFFFWIILRWANSMCKFAVEVVAGLARACKANKCALIGGETAEMPGLYAPGEYDLAGFIVGAVERNRLLTGSDIKPGDLLLGLPSTGLHTNGYSLVRKLLSDAELSHNFADELLKIHKSYLAPIRALHGAKLLKGAAHITGGGLTGNIPRILPRNCAVEIDPRSWPRQPIFDLLQHRGNIPQDDLRRTFNLGIGMVFVSRRKQDWVRFANFKEAPGAFPPNRPRGPFKNFEAAEGCVFVTRLGILLSGRGSNFEAIAQNVLSGRLKCEIGFVFSNKPNAPGLARARKLGFPCGSIDSAGVERTAFDRQVVDLLKQHGVDWVCLAGYMRFLSGQFVSQFPNRILNIHPSLLPAFPGLDAQYQALAHGVKITGCTVHLVSEDLDSGPILLQSAVPVPDDDTLEALSSRILIEEHKIYSEAIAWVLKGNYRIEGRRVIRT